MKILFIGDLFARPGRSILHEHLDSIRESMDIDLVIVNCENAAAGFGVTPKIADELFKWGVDVLTSGNHIWNRKEVFAYLDSEPRLLRPANYPAINPGNGSVVVRTRNGASVAVLNIQGRVFMPPIDDPFRTVDEELSKLPDDVRVIVVDIHAEATAEKVAFGLYLDGRVSAVLGTHTHVPTADATVLPEGTAYQTDVGMTGPFRSVIGVESQGAIDRFLTQIPVRFEPASEDARLNGVVIDVDPDTGRARSIERVTR